MTVVCSYGVSARSKPSLQYRRCTRSPPYGVAGALVALPTGEGWEGLLGVLRYVSDPGGVAPSITPGRRGDGRVSVARPHGTERPGGTGGRQAKTSERSHVEGGTRTAVAGGRGRMGGVDAGGCFDMSCCPRETSPRSFHAPGSIPRSLTVAVACFAAHPRPFDDLGSFMV